MGDDATLDRHDHGLERLLHRVVVRLAPALAAQAADEHHVPALPGVARLLDQLLEGAYFLGFLVDVHHRHQRPALALLEAGALFSGGVVRQFGASEYEQQALLLGLLAGLDLPTGGKIVVAGENLAVLDEDARAMLRGRLLGFVFQSFQLLPSLTAIENVMLPLELAGVIHARETAAFWLDRVGLSHRLRHYPKHLSGGEQQRVALARAFAPQPKLILADEPTGNLDAATGHQIIELMFAINAERETTLILVTHDEEIAARCHRRLRMQAGRVEEIA